MFQIPRSRLSGICLIKTILFANILLLMSSCFHRQKPYFTWPVHSPYNLSRKFSIYHQGIDFPKQTGEPVLSSAEGKVLYAGSQFSGYGKMIIIEHQYQWASLYAHLSKISVKPGHYVKKAQKIGEVGNTGRSLGPHLHFEIMYKKQPLNPLHLLP